MGKGVKDCCGEVRVRVGEGVEVVKEGEGDGKDE